MRLRILLIFALLTGVLTLLTLGQPPVDPSFNHLVPGGITNLPETVPVNIVFVGYPQSLVNQAQFLAELPATYTPIVRSRYPYGITETLGLKYQFQYNVTYASPAWQNSFFSALSALAQPAARTLFQDDYNAAKKKGLDVTEIGRASCEGRGK